MFTPRVVFSSVVASMLVVFSASAAKPAAVNALAKPTADFYALSTSLATTLQSLNKRVEKASPSDKEMLNKVISQVSVVDATADGVLALGTVASEIRDSGSQAIAKKALATRCTALKAIAGGSAPYVGGLANSIALPASIADANKAKDLLTQMSQSSLCAAVGK